MVSPQTNQLSVRSVTGLQPAFRGIVISKCANPRCSASFRYLHEGKLFQFEVRLLDELTISIHAAREKPSREIERFWLCESCSKIMTLVREPLTHRVVIALFEDSVLGTRAAPSDDKHLMQQQPDAGTG